MPESDPAPHLTGTAAPPDGEPPVRRGRRPLEGRELFVALRWLVVIVVSYLILSKKADLAAITTADIIIALLLASNVGLYLLPRAWFGGGPLRFLVFAFDVGLISLAIYVVEGLHGNLYLVYFMTIILAAMGQDFKGSLLIAFIASSIYLILLLQSRGRIDLMETNTWLALPFFFINALFGGFLAGETKKERLEKEEALALLKRYMDADVVDEMRKQPGGMALGGTRREVTVLFADLRRFSETWESLPPEELVSRLNEYFTHMTTVVFRNKGVVDKYIGDAILVFFGAPLVDPDHPLHAVQTAIEMQGVMRLLQVRWRREGKSAVGMGIGINTGEAVVGNIGSTARMEFTVVGKAVNVAARLQTMAQENQILIAGSTYDRVKGLVEARELGQVDVRGAREPVSLYEVL